MTDEKKCLRFRAKLGDGCVNRNGDTFAPGVFERAKHDFLESGGGSVYVGPVAEDPAKRCLAGQIESVAENGEVVIALNDTADGKRMARMIEKGEARMSCGFDTETGEMDMTKIGIIPGNVDIAEPATRKSTVVRKSGRMSNNRGLKLTRTDFDNMENRDAIITKDLGVFVDDEQKTAHLKVSEYLSEHCKGVVYLGWDRGVYPQYKVEEVLFK